MHPTDAQRLGLRDNQNAWVVSATNLEGVWDLHNGRKVPMVGKVMTTERVIRVGSPAFSFFARASGHPARPTRRWFAR